MTMDRPPALQKWIHAGFSMRFDGPKVRVVSFFDEEPSEVHVFDDFDAAMKFVSGHIMERLSNTLPPEEGQDAQV